MRCSSCYRRPNSNPVAQRGRGYFSLVTILCGGAGSGGQQLPGPPPLCVLAPCSKLLEPFSASSPCHRGPRRRAGEMRTHNPVRPRASATSLFGQSKAHSDTWGSRAHRGPRGRREPRRSKPCTASAGVAQNPPPGFADELEGEDRAWEKEEHWLCCLAGQRAGGLQGNFYRQCVLAARLTCLRGGGDVLGS